MKKVKAVGCDLSKWQDAVHYSSLAQDVDFAIIRAGYTGYSNGKLCKDSTFETHASGCLSNGIHIGLYWFSQAVNIAEAIAEAEMCVSLARGYTVDYPIVIDTELSGAKGNIGRADRLDRRTRTDVVKAFCERVQELGYYAAFYCSQDWLNTKLYKDELRPYDWWAAKWSILPPNGFEYGIWQYTNKGSVGGYSDRVDLNYAFKDYPTVIRNANLNGFKGRYSVTVSNLTDIQADELAEYAKSKYPDSKCKKE